MTDYTPTGERVLRTATDLDLIRANPAGKYALGAHIHLTAPWTAIPELKNGGLLDGRGYTITGLYPPAGTAAAWGLFGSVQAGATVRRVTAEGHNHGASATVYDGLIAGQLAGGVIEDVIVRGRLAALDRAGGAAGYVGGGTLRRVLSYVLLEDIGQVRVGSVAGFVEAGITATACYALLSRLLGTNSGGTMTGGSVGDADLRTPAYVSGLQTPDWVLNPGSHPRLVVRPVADTLRPSGKQWPR